jgi:hypothetical protein
MPKEPPQTKFQFPHMFGSGEVKSLKLAYHLFGRMGDFI